MNDKKRKLVITILIVIIILGGIGVVLYLKYNNHIPEDYIAIFNGGSGEITYSTYIYKINNGKGNFGFKYINTTNTTESGESSDCKIKITSRGKVNWTDDVFKVAKNNGAYSYVLLPNDSKVYSIEEFMGRFSMD